MFFYEILPPNFELVIHYIGPLFSCQLWISKINIQSQSSPTVTFNPLLLLSSLVINVFFLNHFTRSSSLSVYITLLGGYSLKSYSSFLFLSNFILIDVNLTLHGFNSRRSMYEHYGELNEWYIIRTCFVYYQWETVLVTVALSEVVELSFPACWETKALCRLQWFF